MGRFAFFRAGFWGSEGGCSVAAWAPTSTSTSTYTCTACASTNDDRSIIPIPIPTATATRLLALGARRPRLRVVLPATLLVAHMPRGVRLAVRAVAHVRDARVDADLVPELLRGVHRLVERRGRDEHAAGDRAAALEDERERGVREVGLLDFANDIA